ncbi:fasciclin-2 [Tribolium castaneum]|uniref:Tyrosine-protein phosphatase Lar-like Protein n=1 Tax=Tribolium castaneum TaxID=7070 RepID=D2A2M5_TRICA|nr:PREDICTED: fasciclin-2 [Tribolium castaneum]EFA02221.1 Tyrosine-protein phosphatase Lar-like Protein [Tribolium castaneum]|eukprot:XP_008191811.1 PREDICTED: fasciclin-2 [Tribolium castaneum]
MAVCLVGLVLLALALDAGGFYISQKSATKVVNNETFIVFCRDDVGGLPIKWRNQKGEILGPKTRPAVHNTSYGTSIMFTNPLRVEDSGNYTCSTGKEERVFQFLVDAPLKFTDTSTNQTAVEGSEFNLKCEVKGGSTSWSMDEGSAITDNAKYAVLGDGLLIRNVTRSDSKTYICKGVQPSTGTVLDRPIHLHVLHKPVHPNHPQRHVRQEVIYGYINGTANLTCVTIANPPATFVWKKHRDPKKKIGKTISESDEISILQLHIRDKSFFDNYTCIARNKYGVYEEHFTLKEGARPLPPSQLQLEEIKSKSLIFKIHGPANSSEMDLGTKGFNVKYKKIDDNEWKQKDFNITQDNLYSLEGLEPNTEYEVQAATRNAAGLSVYVSSSTYTTSRGAAVHSTLPHVLGAAIISLKFFW